MITLVDLSIYDKGKMSSIAILSLFTLFKLFLHLEVGKTK